MDNHTQYSGFAGVDLAKKVMQIHFVTGDGEITDKSAKRAEFLDFFRNRTKCLIGMEACGASQDWARKLEAMGHEVHLMSPKAVKPFVSGQTGRTHQKLSNEPRYRSPFIGDLTRGTF